MLQMNQGMRFELALMAGQLSMVSDRFGHDMRAVIEEGIGSQCISHLAFELLRPAGETKKECHAKFMIDIEYDERGEADFTVRCETDLPGCDADTQELCGDFDMVITRLLEMGAKVSGCYWRNVLTVLRNEEGDRLTREHGYTPLGRDDGLIDCTKPRGGRIQNGACDGLSARAYASSAIMSDELD